MNESVPFPENGFYYHFKHDPAGEVNIYAYEVLGIGKHTEDDSYAVIYRPLYENAWLGKANFCVRPLSIFTSPAKKLGKAVPRFTKVTDVATIARLTRIMQEMYHPS